MYLKIYLKALLSCFNELFDFFGKIQSILTAFLAVIAILFAANFTVYFEPIKAFYPKIIIAVSFLALFICSYRAWSKQYEKNIVNKPLGIVVTNTRSDLSVQSISQGLKLGTIRLRLTFFISNKNNNSINVKGFELRSYMKSIGLNSTDSISSNPSTLPQTIESNNALEFDFSCAIDLRSADFKQQLEIIKSLPNRIGSVKTYIYSVDGIEHLEIPIEINNIAIIESLKNSEYKLDPNVIKLVLGA
jgi:hypothetical protein